VERGLWLGFAGLKGRGERGQPLWSPTPTIPPLYFPPLVAPFSPASLLPLAAVPPPAGGRLRGDEAGGAAGASPGAGVNGGTRGQAPAPQSLPSKRIVAWASALWPPAGPDASVNQRAAPLAAQPCPDLIHRASVCAGFSLA
jgi:hypothetical protein